MKDQEEQRRLLRERLQRWREEILEERRRRAEAGILDDEVFISNPDNPEWEEYMNDPNCEIEVFDYGAILKTKDYEVIVNFAVPTLDVSTLKAQTMYWSS